MSKRVPGRNSPYWTPRQDYLTAIHWCLRYNDWKHELVTLPDTSRGIRYDTDKVQTSNDFDATAELAMKRAEIEEKIQLLESVAKVCMPQCTEYLIKGVTTEGIRIEDLIAQGMPYGRNTYLLIRQKFYHLLSKRI